MKREVSVLGEVRDVEGGRWEVRETRDTKYGFDLLFGTPLPKPPGPSGGSKCLIATRPLVEFWEANSTRRDGVIMDLPAGRTTLKRMRRRLGFHYFDDLAEFWWDRIEDLRRLSAREFAKRHNVNVNVVFETRRKVLGTSTRELDWWREPKPLKILKSNVPLRVMGEKLDISISHAKRLRDRAIGQE